MGSSVHFNQSFYHVSQCPLAAQIWEPGSLQPLQDASSLDMPGAWSISQILAGVEGNGSVCGGGRQRDCCLSNGGEEFALLEREEVTVREEGRERRDRGLGGGSGDREHVRAPLGAHGEETGVEAVGVTAPAPSAGSTQTPVSTSLSVLLRIASLPLPCPSPRSDTSSWECVFSTVFSLLATCSSSFLLPPLETSGPQDPVGRAAQTLCFRCSARSELCPLQAHTVTAPMCSVLKQGCPVQVGGDSCKGQQGLSCLFSRAPGFKLSTLSSIPSPVPVVWDIQKRRAAESPAGLGRLFA